MTNHPPLVSRYQLYACVGLLLGCNVIWFALAIGVTAGLGVQLGSMTDDHSRLDSIEGTVGAIKKIIDPSVTAECNVKYLYTNGFHKTTAFEEKVSQCMRVRFQTNYHPASVDVGSEYNPDDRVVVDTVCRKIVAANNDFWEANLHSFLDFVDYGVTVDASNVPTSFSPNSVHAFCMAVTTVKDVSDFIQYPQCETYFAMVAQVAGHIDDVGGTCTFLHFQGICDYIHQYMTMNKKVEYCAKMSYGTGETTP